MQPAAVPLRHPAFAVTVDAIADVSTGISAADRGRTIRRLAHPHATSSDFSRPGHVVPVRVNRWRVLASANAAESAADLAVLAGMSPAGAFGQIVSTERPTEMARGAELAAFATRNGLALVTVPQLLGYRRAHERVVRRVVAIDLDTPYGPCQAAEYDGVLTDQRFLALAFGDVAAADDVPVYVRHECLLCSILGAKSCGCEENVNNLPGVASSTGRGVLIYLRASSIAVLDRQSTVDNWVITQILTDFGIRSASPIVGAGPDIVTMRNGDQPLIVPRPTGRAS
jgi:3,4-dihydroxy 2-butanone 4-phosphate synthase/GTP cyclohydrolase II